MIISLLCCYRLQVREELVDALSECNGSVHAQTALAPTSDEGGDLKRRRMSVLTMRQILMSVAIFLAHNRCSQFLPVSYMFGH